MPRIRKINGMDFYFHDTSKDILSWGGMVFLKQKLDKIGFMKLIEDILNLPR